MGRGTTPPPARATWAYFLDVDGTLIAFADHPSAIQVDDALLGLLARLYQVCGGALALVSGRTLADLEERLGRGCLPLAGQHGLERRDATHRVHVVAAAPTATSALQHRLAPLLARYPGLVLEDKGLTLALHYRQAPRLGGYLHRVLRGWLAQHGAGLHMQTGKYVLEIKPARGDKGSAIGAFMAEPPFQGRTPVCIGDDVTDEHGFAMVNRLGGYTIKVGPGRTCAGWRLPDVDAVRAWLAAALLDPGAHA